MNKNSFSELKSLTPERRAALKQRLIDRDLLNTKNSVDETVLPSWEISAEERSCVEAGINGGAENISGIYPLTPMQEGLLFHRLISQGHDPYVLHQSMSFNDRCLLDQFVQALKRLIKRHDILRTAIVWEALDSPVQVVCRQVELPCIEINGEGNEVNDAWLMAQSTLIDKPIDIAAAPLIRLLCACDSTGRWRVLLVTHHLIADRASLQLMQSELVAILKDGSTASVPAHQFGEYACRVHAIGTAPAKEFFKKLLGDVHEPTLPFDLGVTIDAETPLRQSVHVLDKAVLMSLRRVASDMHVGVPALVHLAWALAVGRVSGREDVVFGTVLSGRSSNPLGTATMLGMLINTLPFRIKVAASSVYDSVLNAQKLLNELVEHEHAPLAHASEMSGVSSPAPLFSALLDYRRTATASAPDSSSIALERTSYPLVLTVTDSGEQMDCVVQCIEQIDSKRMLGYFHNALSEIINTLRQAPHTDVMDLELLPQQERAVLALGSNREVATADISDEFCIHQLFEQWASRTPDAPCVITAERVFTYSQVNTWAEALAWQLCYRGIGTESRVALSLERSVNMVVSMLGVMKAGAAYVPLDPAYPPARQRLLARLSSPALALIDEASPRSVFDEIGIPVLDLNEALENVVDQQEGVNRVPHSRPTQAAYLMFTSGSTGEPKGVLVEHRSVVALAKAQARWCALEPSDRVLQFASYSFDNSVAEIFPALTMGAAIVLRLNSPVAPDALFAAHMVQTGVTVADLPTAFWHEWARQLGAGDRDCVPVSPLRLVLAGGEKASRDAIEQWYSVPECAQIRLSDSYGPTETTVNAIVGNLRLSDVADGHELTMGKPLGNARVYILDQFARLVPVGVTGQICIGGPGVARGYLGRSALTAKQFIPDPFGPSGSRLYLTGDLGRWDDSGRIAYRGRSDSQLKVRGYRIESGEIELTLCKLPSVKNAKVVAHEGLLIAYIVKTHNAAQDDDELRQELGVLLPSFMIPATFICVKSLPVNTHGKIDVNALPLPTTQGMADTVEHPQGEIEQSVAKIWRELLGYRHVGRHDDFFAHGGHSLLAIRFIARVKTQLSVIVTVRDLFSHPTVAAFSATIKTAERLVTAEQIIPRLPVSNDLSFAQQRLLFLCAFDPRQSRAYHLVGGLHATGVLQADALKQALDTVVERHEVLHTAFRIHGGVPQLHRLDPANGVAWKAYSVGDQSTLATLFADAACEPFDLENGPLVRANLLRLTETEHVLIIALHHMIADGWSLSLLATELSSLYSSLVRGESSTLPAPSLQYSDYASWQLQRIAENEEGRLYWYEHLKHAPTLLALPTDRPRPARQCFEGASMTFSFDKKLTRALRDLSQRRGVTLYMTLLAGYSILLSRLSGQDSVVIGTPIAGRPFAELEPLIGFFANTLALHVHLDGRLVFHELLERVKGVMLSAQEHADVPFGHVVERVNPPRRVSHNPIYQAELVWQNTPASTVSLDNLELQEIHPKITSAKCDFSLMLEEGDKAIVGTAIYMTGLYDQETVKHWLDALQSILQEITLDESVEVDRLRMTSLLTTDCQFNKELVGLATSTPSDTANNTIVSLFERQVERTPEATALVYYGTAISYQELNARANQLAWHLCDVGVRPAALVGICVGRSIEMVVALLGILKAGGAYVSLSCNTSQTRLNDLFEHFAPDCVVTQLCLEYKVSALEPETSVVLDRDWEVIAQKRKINPAGLAKPQSMAYVAYRFESTGKPEGVCVEHGGILDSLTFYQEKYPLGQNSTTLLKSSLVYDVSVLEIFWPLLFGAKSILVNSRYENDVDHLRALARSANVTTLQTTPPLLDSLFETGTQQYELPALKHVFVSGDALQPSSVRKFQQFTKGRVTLCHSYGSVECVVAALHGIVDGASGSGANMVGYPIANKQAFILDDFMNPVPERAVGELYIGGEGLARGYLGQLALTQERFIISSIDQDSPTRLYKTGDRACFQPDGSIKVFGRMNSRFELTDSHGVLAAIESLLKEQAGIEQAAVILEEDTPGKERIVGYLVGQEATISPGEIERLVAAQLPDIKVPTTFVVVTALPLALGGKLDRSALPTTPMSGHHPAGEYVVPEGESEQWLADTWKALLNVPRVGRNDNFFELGGHSLLIMQLTSQMAETFNVDMPMEVIFEAPVLHTLAEKLVDARLALFDPDVLNRFSNNVDEFVNMPNRTEPQDVK